VFENIDKVTLTGSMEIGLSMCKKILLLSHVIVALEEILLRPGAMCQCGRFF
jgi:hypothetical protein